MIYDGIIMMSLVHAAKNMFNKPSQMTKLECNATKYSPKACTSQIHTAPGTLMAVG